MTQTYQLKITLRGTKPPIWRRLLVPGSLNLERLHRVIQDAMGWENSHLHSFEVHGAEFGAADSDEWGGDVKAENQHTLERLLRVKDRFTYRYDFGDGWEHQIVVEKITPGEPAAPSVIAGARACPPEDCGGIWGYEELVAALADKRHPRHAALAEWAPPDWTPERFDLAAADKRVAKHRPRASRARPASSMRAPRTPARAKP